MSKRLVKTSSSVSAKSKIIIHHLTHLMSYLNRDYCCTLTDGVCVQPGLAVSCHVLQKKGEYTNCNKRF